MTIAAFEAELADVFPGVVFHIERPHHDDTLIATVGNVVVSTWDGTPTARWYRVRVEHVHTAAHKLRDAYTKFRDLVQSANRGLALLEPA